MCLLAGSESRVEPHGSATCQTHDRMQKWLLETQQPLVQAHLLGVNVAK